MDGSFRFEDGTSISERGNARLYTVCGNGRKLNILLVSRSMADRMFLLKNGGLVFTEAALLEDDQGGLRLETTKASNIIRTYPADLFARPGKAVKKDDDGIFGEYLIETEAVTAEVSAERSASAAGTGGVMRFSVRVSGECANVPGSASNPETAASKLPDNIKDMLLRIRYAGDVAELFSGDEMISDNFWNGDIWEIGLKEHAEKLRDPLTLRIAPPGKGALITAESAGREEKDNVCELVSIEVQPVYDIRF